MQRKIGSTLILTQSAGLQKLTAWPPLAKQPMLKWQIQWTFLAGKQSQEQGWKCFAVHSKRGEHSADVSYANDAGCLVEEFHSPETVNKGKER